MMLSDFGSKPESLVLLYHGSSECACVKPSFIYSSVLYIIGKVQNYHIAFLIGTLLRPRIESATPGMSIHNLDIMCYEQLTITNGQIYRSISIVELR